MAKGIIYNTVYREDHTGLRTPLSAMQNQPETIGAIADYDASSQFYTYGFDWYLRHTAYKVNAIDPGYTKTDFNPHQGTGTVEDAAVRVVKYALIDNNGPTEKYFSEETNPQTGEISC